MILKRKFLTSDVTNPDSKVSSSITVGYESLDGTITIGGFHVYHVAEADRWARNEMQRMGVSVSQIIAAELCTEEKLLVALADTQDKLARLLSALELFAGFPEDSAKPNDRVLETPESFCRIGHTEEERAEYTKLYHAALEAGGVYCEVEPLLSRIVLHPSTAGSMYVVMDAPEGEKDGSQNVK